MRTHGRSMFPSTFAMYETKFAQSRRLASAAVFGDLYQRLHRKLLSMNRPCIIWL